MAKTEQPAIPIQPVENPILCPPNRPSPIPKGLSWDTLVKLDGDDLDTHYRHCLEELGKWKGVIGQFPARRAAAAVCVPPRFCGKALTAFTFLGDNGKIDQVQRTEVALKLVERTFELHGPEGLGAKPRPELIGPVLGTVHGTLLDTVRMGFLHSSRTRGRIPLALKKASDVRYLGHAAGPQDSTLLRFEVPEFGSVASELFEQGQLWDAGPKPEQTAFDLLATTLHDVRHMAKNSERFDHALLHRFASYRRLLRRGVNSIVLPDSKAPPEGAHRRRTGCCRGKSLSGNPATTSRPDLRSFGSIGGQQTGPWALLGR